MHAFPPALLVRHVVWALHRPLLHLPAPLLLVSFRSAGLQGTLAHLSQTETQAESSGREGGPGLAVVPLAPGPPVAAEGSSTVALSHDATECLHAVPARRLWVSGRPRARQERGNKSAYRPGQLVGVLGPL